MITHHETTVEGQQEGYNLFSWPYSFSFSNSHFSPSFLLLQKNSFCFLIFAFPLFSAPLQPAFPSLLTMACSSVPSQPWSSLTSWSSSSSPHPPSGQPLNTADNIPLLPQVFLLASASPSPISLS